MFSLPLGEPLLAAFRGSLVIFNGMCRSGLLLVHSGLLLAVDCRPFGASAAMDRSGSIQERPGRFLERHLRMNAAPGASSSMERVIIENSRSSLNFVIDF